MRRLTILLVAGVFAAASVGSGRADEDEYDPEQDHETAREAVRRGAILPLDRILERVRRDFRGEMLAVELEREHHRGLEETLVYEVKLLAPDGAVTELYYDARTGDLLRARGHRLEEHERRGPDDLDGRDAYDDRDGDDD